MTRPFLSGVPQSFHSCRSLVPASLQLRAHDWQRAASPYHGSWPPSKFHAACFGLPSPLQKVKPSGCRARASFGSHRLFSTCAPLLFSVSNLERERSPPRYEELAAAKINELVAQYELTILNPDHTLITGKRARRKFFLTRKDLVGLSCRVRQVENPYDEESPENFQQYWLPDVVKLASGMHGQEQLIKRYRAYLENGGRNEDASRVIFGMSDDGTTSRQDDKQEAADWKVFLRRVEGAAEHRRSNCPEGSEAVKQAFFTNTGIWGLKTTVWFSTGSVAMFVDSMHSLADVLNSLYRWVSIYQSERRPDLQHPYGYDRRRFVSADRSAFVVVVLGGLFPLMHGWHDMFVPYEITMPLATVAVFASSAVLEFFAFKKAYGELKIQAEKQNMSVMQYYKEGSEMMSISTLTEAFIGMLGALIGTAGITVAWYTGSSFYDAFSGLCIAGLVACTGIGILHKNEEMLVGKTLKPATVIKIALRLEEDTGVITSVHDIKTEIYGVKAVRFKAELNFNAEAVTRRHLNLRTIPSPESEKLAMTLKSLTATGDEKELQDQCEDWLMQNNAEFLIALTKELKRAEVIVRAELKALGYTNIHIDLEPL